jgi:hypothetical protein
MKARQESHLAERVMTRVAALDIKIVDVELVPDQFPQDDLDDGFATLASVTFELSGRQLARTLGVQERVLERELATRGWEKRLLARIRNDGREILKAARRDLVREVAVMAREFDRGARKVQFDWDLGSSSHSSVRVTRKSPPTVRVEAEIEVLGSWV